MSVKVSKEFVQGLPKAELHVHIEGTLEPELKLKLAQRNHVDIGQSTIQEVKDSYKFTDLASFLAVYYHAMNVLRNRTGFLRLSNGLFTSCCQK